MTKPIIMKHIEKGLFTTAIIILFSVSLIAQVSNTFNYQAVVRDANGNVLQNQNIALRIAILQDTPTGTEIYAERHTRQTNEFGLINLEIGTGTPLNGLFAAIPWGNITPYLKIGIDLAGGDSYTDFGTSKIASVPYAYMAGQLSFLQLDPVLQSVSLQAVASAAIDDPIFEIRNKDGIVMLGVYNEGVRINVLQEEVKGSKSGFAVGSFSRETKAEPDDILRITSDDVNFYLPDFSGGKSSKGGFAVGSFSRETKADPVNFLNISPSNYFIGHDVAPNITTGLRNAVLGFNAGYSLAGGSDNIFIGNRAGFSTGAGTIGGNENIFIGNEAGYNTTSPVRNVFIGHEAGRENISGQYNVYLGNIAGKNNNGFYNTVLGANAASNNAFGNSNVVIGYVAGRDLSSGKNVIIGQGAGYNNTAADGENVFIGFYAGETLSAQSKRLAISSDRTAPILIYGEFDNRRVAINGTTTNNYTFYVNGPAGGTSSWNSLSDLRHKKDIETIHGALGKVLSLRGVTYKWNEDITSTSGVQMGFVAQEVENIIPEVVNHSENDTYTMQYAPLTALLVEAMKEQQQQIEELKKENMELRQISDKLAQMEQKYNELMKLLEHVTQK